MINSSYYLATSDRCSVPAPSIAFCAGGWLAIVGQLRGKGRDRVGAAEPEESVIAGVGCRGSGVGEKAFYVLLAARRLSLFGSARPRCYPDNLAEFSFDARPPIRDTRRARSDSGNVARFCSD